MAEIGKIADNKSGALIAVDGIDSSDILAGKARLPLKTVDEQRDYLFSMEAEDQNTAENIASDILHTVRTERDKPVYSDFRQFLREYAQAAFRDQIQAVLLYGDDDERIDLLIFVPGQSEYDAAKIYYRGSAAQCCCELLKHFTTIPVKS